MKPSYVDQILAEIRKARKSKDAPRLHYYTEALDKVAVVSYDTFKGSWAGESWFKANEKAISRYRFSI